MEANNVHPIVVPYDFTPVSDIAIDHAAQMAKLFNNPITLINIIDKSTQYFIRSNNLIENLLNTKLKEICEVASKKYNIPVNFVIRKSRIIKIRKIADDLHASMMVIGIDQPKSAVSQVLRMIGTSPAPVYVIQKQLDWKPFKTIVFPVDKFEETRQKVSCCVKLAKTTNANVKLFSIKKKLWSDQQKQDVVIKQIKKVLIENNIPFTLDHSKGKEENFEDEILEFGKAQNADLFILMKTPQVYFANTFFHKGDKKVLLNAHNIPAVYVNSRDYGRYY